VRQAWAFTNGGNHNRPAVVLVTISSDDQADPLVHRRDESFASWDRHFIRSLLSPSKASPETGEKT
jgi:hypothetical protein